MRSPHVRESLEIIEAALTDPALEDQVDMVLSSPDIDRYRAATSDGSIEFTRTGVDGRYVYEVAVLDGTNPLASDDARHLVGLDAEVERAYPHRDDNAYPHAFDQIAQFFDGDHAPELVAQHTSHHRFDANLGQHGSLGIVQARAPFIVSGAGIAPLGMIDESARMIDVAPTIMRLLGGEPHPDGVGPTGEHRPDALLRRQDGDELAHLAERGAADHVVVILLDGCNANMLYRMVAEGALPAIASLLEDGLGLRHGVLASLPTATLANHTAASTGAHPGHSGVLHHTWWNRDEDTTPDLLSLTEMFTGMQHLDATVETIHQAVHRNRPGAFTSAAFEFCDTGADFSSFRLIASGDSEPLPTSAELEAPDHGWTERSASYGFMTTVDELATRQTLKLWSGGEGNPLPTFSWLSLSLTDEAGHEGGPHAEITRAAMVDSDRRVARVIDAVDRSGARHRTTFLVFSDHGMEQARDVEVTTWDEALASTDVAHRDVSSGLIYLDSPLRRLATSG